MVFWRKKRSGTVNEKLLLQLTRELNERSSRKKDTGHYFIHPDVAKDVLRREHIKALFSALDWYDEDDRTDLWRNMSLILCILISMSWGEWDEFPAYFFNPGTGLKAPRWTDGDLPIKREEFSGKVPPEFSERFHEHQYRFVPISIREDSHLELTTDHRLPILEVEPLRDVEGAQGFVEKIHVEKRFLHYKNGASNDSPEVMACKRITANTATGKLNFKTEQRVLEQFKELCVTNDRIMQSFASFIHGSDFLIISPWANGRDLHMFLTRPDKIFDNFPERSFRFSPDSLLAECYHLARALNFLHRELWSPRGKKLCCAHLDLKPENVLVSFPPNDRASEAPVGRWKIADFGLSKVEEVVTEGRVIPVGKADQAASTAPGNIARELSVQTAARGAGTFQPPEVQNTGPVKVSTRRDVWSYGCILAMVLAFALGGPEEVKEQTRKREIVGSDDFFYRRTYRRSRTPGPSGESAAYHVDAELKPAFRRWLSEARTLADNEHEQWINRTVELILTLLDVNVTTRPEIPVAVNTLNMIIDSTADQAKHRLWDFEERTNPVETVVIPPTDSLPPRLDTSTAFVGARDPSPPSSASYTAPMSQSPGGHRKRSSGGSSSFFSRNDPSQSFAKLAPPHKCQGATLEPFGHAAALWSTADVKLYNLSPLHADPTTWSDRPTNTQTELEALALGGIPLSDHSKCRRVQLAGQWLAILEQSLSSSFSVRLLFRSDQRQAYEQARTPIFLGEAPEEMKLSSHGTLALKYSDHVKLYTCAGSVSTPLTKEFVAMTFSQSGQYFCIWERDRRGRENNRVYNYWTVWSQDTSASGEFQMLGQTIRLELPPYDPSGSSGSTILASFSTYPRFIACDRQQYVYIVRADVQKDRAHLLGRTDNAVAGFVLPDDKSFILLRGSQHERQRAERCAMSFTNDPSLQSRSCGRLHENIDIRLDGVVVVPESQHDGQPCLLTLKPSGLLGRKLLSPR